MLLSQTTNHHVRFTLPLLKPPRRDWILFDCLMFKGGVGLVVNWLSYEGCEVFLGMRVGVSLYFWAGFQLLLETKLINFYTFCLSRVVL